MTTERTTGARRAGRGGVQVLGGVLAALAIFGSVVLFFTDDVRLLRLGLVALLWVAFAALMAVVRFRKDAEASQARAHEQGVVYSLELEREVRARRGRELAQEHEVRDRVGAEVRAEGRLQLDELRDELRVLRESLSVLVHGDFLAERVALRAESTRLRLLTDTARVEATPSVGQLSGVPPLDAETVEADNPEADNPEADNPEADNPEVPEEPGAHSTGRSVSDLMAAFGVSVASRRRREG
ncbi:MAG: DUF6779 domain-containing protein [Mycobacteriaceae bacterium]